MNPNFPNELAAKIKANPALLEDADDAMLCDLIFHYVEGDLPAEQAGEVEAMIRASAKAKATHERILEANRFRHSAEGAAWLTELPERVWPTRATPRSQELNSEHAQLTSILIQIKDFLFGRIDDGLEVAVAMGATSAERRRRIVRNLGEHAPSLEGLTLAITSEARPGGHRLEFTIERTRAVTVQFPVFLWWKRLRGEEELSAEKLVFEKIFSKQRREIVNADPSETWAFHLETT